MKTKLKLLLITAIVIPIVLIAIKAYASGGVTSAIIDTEVCTECGVCYAVQSMWIVEDSTNGYPYWVHAEGGSMGLLYYWYPKQSHMDVIADELIPNCPSGVFIKSW